MKRLIATVAMVLACAAAAGAAAPAPLTTLRAVAALTNVQAASHPAVAFEATVIYFFRRGRDLNVQDDGVAIYVRPTMDIKLAPGDRVLIRGNVEPSFLPYVLSNSITILGHGAPPKPVDATFADLLSTGVNCRLVRVRGIIRAADVVTYRSAPDGRMQLLMDGGYADVHVETRDKTALRKLLDAEVEVTGAAGRLFDSKMQQTGVKIKVQSLADIRVIKPAGADPWSLPITPLDKVMTAYDVRDLSKRVRVHGTITYYQPGIAVVLQNGSQSLWISTQTVQPLQIGDAADATGFPAADENHLSLAHAEIRDTHVRAPIQPLNATWRELARWAPSTSGGHQYDLVSIEGRVVAEVREATQDEYVVSSGGQLFTAIYRHPRSSLPLQPMLRIPPDSTIRVTGICFVMEDTAPTNGEAPFQVLLRSFGDIVIVARPSLLNVRNLIIVIGLLLMAVLVAAARSWMLERKVRRETAGLAYLERRRSRILEQINNARPLEEIVEQVTEVVSFRLRGAPCWCEIAGGACIGNKPPKITSQKVVSHEVAGRPGTKLGAIYAAVHSPAKARKDEETALALGAGLVTLAIETSQLYSDLVHRSEYDLLTDIQNRFSMERSLDKLIQSARQSGSVFGLVYIDLNRFKQVNDLYGHHVGDQYLQEMTQRMKRQLRPGDTLARLGGDEFAALIPDVRNRDGVAEVAQRLERCFDEPFASEDYVVHGSASIGIALYPQDGATKDGLLSAADAAMYVAKHAERNEGQTEEGRGTGELTFGSRT